MTIQEALTLYKIPFTVTATTTAGGFTSYQLSPAGATATPERLKSKLSALSIALGTDCELITDSNNLYLRIRDGERAFYNYQDFNGYIDNTSPNIPFIVGFTTSGGIILDSLDNSRHLLVAGTTGSGKSVFLHNLIFTFACNPHTNIYIVDCKKVELSLYAPRAVVASEVFGELSAARLTADFVQFIDDRYNDMLKCGVNNFTDYKRIKPDAKRNILVVDELADLISDKKARNCIIPRLLRIAQIGRAAGCHLILATQRPDHTIINGTLKGNLPSRMAFNCSSVWDSRIILDRAGAERLTGNGDGLYLRNAALNPERVQAPYISLGYINDRMNEYKKRTA